MRVCILTINPVLTPARSRVIAGSTFMESGWHSGGENNLFVAYVDKEEVLDELFPGKTSNLGCVEIDRVREVAYERVVSQVRELGDQKFDYYLAYLAVSGNGPLMSLLSNLPQARVVFYTCDCFLEDKLSLLRGWSVTLSPLFVTKNCGAHGELGEAALSVIESAKLRLNYDDLYRR